MSEAGLREAQWYEALGVERVRCKLCPWFCVLEPGHIGFCGVRENRNGKLVTLVYGLVSSMGIDPIEKKPLYNFYPGASIVSISTVGCNFKCPWCQNWSISQSQPSRTTLDYLEPEKVVKIMKKYEVPFLAFTYNEPFIWYEYVLDVARLVKREGGFNVLVTNGYVNAEPLEELVKYIDAANVDIKSFNNETYLKIIKGKLDAVLTATSLMKERGVHVEITYLIVPNINDRIDEFAQMVKWHLDVLGPDTPLHISRFYPAYKFIDRSPTSIETLTLFWKSARNEGLRYVYVGNVPGHSGEYTYCPSCGKPVIRRVGYDIIEWNLTPVDNRCKFCGAKVAITGYKWAGRRSIPYYL